MIKIIPKLLKLRAHRPVFANIAVGTHAGQFTRTLEATASSRYLLGKEGTAAHEVDICGAADRPLGVITDEGTAGDLVNVALPGSASNTVLMVASEAITVGSAVYTAPNGKVQGEPSSGGIYYEVGHALTPTSGDGQLIEVDPIEPRKLLVMAAFSGTAATDIALLGIALEGGPDKIIVLPA